MTLALIQNTKEVLEFGPFRMERWNRSLMRDGAPVHLRQREFDILVLLIENADRFVSKGEITRQIWPNAQVDDANVRVHISAIRRALGDGNGKARLIRSGTRDGYCFAAVVRRFEAGSADDPSALRFPRMPDTRRSNDNLPVSRKVAVGRSVDIQSLTDRIPDQRLISIVGPGGIGKTTVALEVADVIKTGFSDGVHFVNLASLTDPQAISSTIMTSLGIDCTSSDPDLHFIEYLNAKSLLLVFDNCEHLIDAVAMLVEKILTHTRHVTCLTTSREPLRIDGEWTYRLGPLELPSEASPSAEAALKYPSVRLFVERAKFGDPLFMLTDNDAPLVCDLCRQLDGNPLAMELAAGRLDLFGLRGLVKGLTRTFELLSQGRRTALPRQQTLRATMDWSYDLLRPLEKTVLWRLSVFRREFTLEQALAVVGDDFQEDIVIEALSELVAKSLVFIDNSRTTARYRLLFLTRTYAAEKLADSGEFSAVSRRHAYWHLEALQTASSFERDSEAVGWTDDIRAAIEWAFLPNEDAALGTRLIQASITMVDKLKLFNDYGRVIARALDSIVDFRQIDPAVLCRLLAERVALLVRTSSSFRDSEEACNRGLALMRSLDYQTVDGKAESEVVMMIFGGSFGAGNPRRMLEAAGQAMQLQLKYENPGIPPITAKRMLSQAHHFLGNHREAIKYGAQVLTHTDAEFQARNLFDSDKLDPRISIGIFMARTLWLQGAPEQASAMCEQVLKRAEAHSAFAHGYALSFAAIPVCIWRGDLTAAKKHIALLADEAIETSMVHWEAWADCYARVIDFHEFGVPDGLPLAELFVGIKTSPPHFDHVICSFPGLADDSVLDRLQEAGALWCAPEFLRSYADRNLKLDRISPSTAEDYLLRALDLSIEQESLSWRLRSATSLARLWKYKGRTRQAADVLQAVLAEFEEGFMDEDLLTADAVLKDINQSL